MADTIIPCEDDPATLPHGTQPFLITRILGEMVIMHLNHCPCLSESLGHDMLAETAIEEKDKRVYAAVRSSSHRIASSISRGGHS